MSSVISTDMSLTVSSGLVSNQTSVMVPVVPSVLMNVPVCLCAFPFSSTFSWLS